MKADPFLYLTNRTRYYYFCPEFGAFAHFLSTRLHESNHPCDDIFPTENLSFAIIFMHLLQSCTPCDIDRSCSIHLKESDNVTWSSFSVGRSMEVSIQNCTSAHYKTVSGNYTEDDTKYFDYIFPLNLRAFAHFLKNSLLEGNKPDDSRAENRSFSII